MDQNREAIELRIRASWEAGAYQAAATLLLESYGAEIFGFLQSRLRDHDATREVFSAAGEDLWRGLPGFAWRCSARAWAYTIARHAAIRYLKVAQQQRRVRVHLTRPSQLIGLEHRSRTQTLPMLKSEVKSRITALRGSLPLEDETLLVLRVNRRLSWNEIAHIMLADTERDDRAACAREAARLRKRFQHVKEKLRALAQAEGLLQTE